MMAFFFVMEIVGIFHSGYFWTVLDCMLNMADNKRFTFQMIIDITGAHGTLFYFDAECIGSPVNIIIIIGKIYKLSYIQKLE